MEKILNTNKRVIIAILTLCILLGIAGTGLNVTAMASETTATVEETAVATEEITTVVVEESTISTEDTAVVTEENTQELVPVMARGCCEDTYGKHPWSSIDEALAHYNMPASSVYECDETYDGIHYSYYVQMDSFRIYVNLA